MESSRYQAESDREEAGPHLRDRRLHSSEEAVSYCHHCGVSLCGKPASRPPEPEDVGFFLFAVQSYEGLLDYFTVAAISQFDAREWFEKEREGALFVGEIQEPRLRRNGEFIGLTTLLEHYNPGLKKPLPMLI